MLTHMFGGWKPIRDVYSFMGHLVGQYYTMYCYRAVFCNLVKKI